MESDVKFCPNCGTELVPNDKFCGNCGYDTQSLATLEINLKPKESKLGQARATSSRMELWRRMALLFGILIGLPLFFYVAPAMVGVTTVDWEKEQVRELKSYSGYVTAESRRLNQLPLSDYMSERTGDKVTSVASSQWLEFFTNVQLASSGQYDSTPYGNRVSEEDKDPLWKPTSPVSVFFKPDEIPFAQWGLLSEDGDEAYISTSNDGKTAYLRLSYQDYSSSISAMYKPYRVAPGWLYNPYRKIGSAVLLLGLLVYIFLPRRKKEPEDISYSTGSMLAGDFVALILLVPFFGLPFFINGGTVQALTGMLVISAVMWFISLIFIILLYYNAWNASYRITLTADSLSRITFRGVREFSFDEITEVNIVSLRNPGWFRKLFLVLAFLSAMSGRASTQPAGSALLANSATYGGLEICGPSGKPMYIWFINQNGGVIIKNFDKVMKAIEASGIRINKEIRKIEGFSMFM
ncbi:MAG: zinc ribbon domain-containing protein [Desulfosporosinus sp.]|nr:zinc ribbon domain-containing protein [Desulfosporosinus sp.]